MKPVPPSPAALRAYYRALYRAWGPQHWWPARSRFEVIAGAFLTQNTNWTNVERALAGLRRARLLSIAGIRRTPQKKLARIIRPSGYFRQKARRLKAFVVFLDSRYGGSLRRMFAQPAEKLRAELLALDGVGPETADSILLYAGGHPVFVVDAYTRRVLQRHRLAHAKTGYEEMRQAFERALRRLPPLPPPSNATPRHPPSPMSQARRPPAARHYGEMHALLVAAGNRHCRSRAQCDGCPLEPFLPRAGKPRAAL
jgi:endonuclease-3 related protein